jgi:hypothetical protein
MDAMTLFDPDQIDAMRTSQRDYDNKLAADRVTALWKTRCDRKPSSLADTPLFDTQQTLGDAKSSDDA